jgi:hypothetical protein
MVQTPIKPTALTVDRDEARKQLELLGYKAGDNVYLTAFFPKGDPRTKGDNRDKGRKSDRLNCAEVEAWQAEGRGVYLVVNGWGHGKEDVKDCRSIFYEHDDLDKDAQLILWQSLGLPEPTVQVDTEGKSIHSYWVLDQPIHPELWAFKEGKDNWKGLQADLLKFASADTSLTNPNRVMRLAGCWYMVNDDSGTHAVAQSRIVGGCGKRYSYNELRQAIPRSKPPQVKQGMRSQVKPSQRNNSQDTGEGLLDFRAVGHLLPEWNERGRSGWATFQCPVHTTSGKHSDDHIHVNLTDGAWTAHCGCDRKLIYQSVCKMVGHKPSRQGYRSYNSYTAKESGAKGSKFTDNEGDGLQEESVKQNFWSAPVSCYGEIGWLRQEKKIVTEKDEEGNETRVIGEDGQPVTEIVRKFTPKANFDFVVERELESEDGGGVVLQVKRSIDPVRKRVIINSVDYGSVKTFEKALKQALGSGIVINLKDEHLKALIHVRLREYRERGGKLYKLIDRYGQQADGVWVFRDRQFKSDGTPTNEEESGWVFNPALGKEDFIPCPELAPQDPEALKRLMDACRVFFGEKNIHQVLMTMGWVVAGIHSQAIFKHDNCFPLINPNGEPGACKTLAAEASLSLVGKNWAQMGMLARVSTSALYEHGSRTAGLPFMMDDPERSDELEEIFKTWYNWKPRRVRGNDQQPKSPLGAITNHVAGAEQAATFTRFIRLTYERASGGNKQAFQQLRKAQETASGAFPLLLKIGYDPEAIATIELELLPHLPLAHARIAQSLAIPLYYAEKLIELTGYSYNLKQWVIENCCKSENDSDNSADSLNDFIDKLLSLESESLVGSWNLKRDIDRSGKSYVALFAADIWASVDKRFSPATYNFKSLKPLVLKAGGVIDTTVRFDRDRDSALAYERAKITADQDPHGDLELNPPATTPRKAWLIPATLFGGDDPPVTGVTGCNWNPVTPPNDDFSRVTTPSEVVCNCVTEKKEIEIETEEAELTEPSTVVDVETFCETPQKPGYTSYTVTDIPETTPGQGLEAVTEILENPVTVTGISVTAENTVTAEAIASPAPAPQPTLPTSVSVVEVADVTSEASPLPQKPSIEVREGTAVEESFEASSPTSNVEESPLEGWDKYNEHIAYPNPKSDNVRSSQKRSLAIREAYRAAKTKEDLSALRCEKGGEFSRDELLWVGNWLKRYIRAEFDFMQATAKVSQPLLDHQVSDAGKEW